MRKITIISVIGRIKLMYVLRWKLSCPQMSISEAKAAVDSLPFSVESFMSKEDIAKLLDGISTYSVEEIHPDDPFDQMLRQPYWQTQEHRQAVQWYNNLPQEDKKKVDILVRNNAAFAAAVA